MVTQPPSKWKELGSDIWALVSLQLQLLSLNTKEFAVKAGWGAAGLLAASLLMVGAVPLIMLAIALEIQAQTRWSSQMSLAAVALCSMFASALLGAVSLYSWRAASQSFADSKEELKNNLIWMKDAFSTSITSKDRF